MRFPMNPDGVVGDRASCPNCAGLSFDLFEDILDIDGAIAIIEICQACSALVNRGAIEHLQQHAESMHRAQVAELREVYPIDPREVAFGATLEEEIPHFLEVLNFFLTKADIARPPTELISAEIGIGRGTLLRAAGKVFGKSYGTDIDFSLFDATTTHLPVPDTVILLESLSHLPEPVDVILAWHTLEHIPRLHDLIAAARLLLKPGGHLYFQVPLYRPENVVESHYTFMNRRSVSVLAEMQRLDVVDIWTDHNRHFLTSILRKPADSEGGR
jgi:SAM-dependent methyltransferase